MAKIVRLTESDLVRLVRKVIKEQAVPNAAPVNNVWDMLKKAIDGMGTNEAGVKRVCGMVTSPELYKQLLAAANKEGSKTVMDYIMTDFSSMLDTPVKTERTTNVNYDEWEADKEVGGLWGKDEDTQTPKFCAKIFKKFNPNEWNAFNKGVRVDYGN
jgi:hypothetical protein